MRKAFWLLFALALPALALPALALPALAQDRCYPP